MTEHFLERTEEQVAATLRDLTRVLSEQTDAFLISTCQGRRASFYAELAGRFDVEIIFSKPNLVERLLLGRPARIFLKNAKQLPDLFDTVGELTWVELHVFSRTTLSQIQSGNLDMAAARSLVQQDPCHLIYGVYYDPPGPGNDLIQRCSAGPDCDPKLLACLNGS